MRRICVVVGSRANYSSIKSAMRAIDAHPGLELQLIVAASALLDRYGSVVDIIERDGFNPIERLHMLIEGETPLTMAKSTGLGLLELSTALERLQPDIVVTVGDRFETMATTLAAAYMNMPIAHTMGGEVTGNIDESIRHAVTKFANIHFPASNDARQRIIRLGEPEDTVHLVGCPRVDLVAEVLGEGGSAADAGVFDDGVGEAIDLTEPFLIVSQHPVTSEYGHGESQMRATLDAVADVGLPALVLWPNADAGADDVARGIRRWREQGRGGGMYFVKNLPVETYIRLMASTACLVGNSSSGIREGAFIGTPVVNVGRRQAGRERGHNVVDSDHERDEIAESVRKQVAQGRFAPDPVYGDGHAGSRIAETLAGLGPIDVQKRITY